VLVLENGRGSVRNQRLRGDKIVIRHCNVERRLEGRVGSVQSR
jgi:isocitrate dehydrogenase kinase/phosphatase